MLVVFREGTVRCCEEPAFF